MLVKKRTLLLLALCFTVLSGTVINSCSHKTSDPVTLSYFRLGWLAQPDDVSTAAPLLKQFTDETGIRLRNLPVPESTLDQLVLSRKLLEQSGSAPDVLGVDLIWSGVLEQDLLDLRPYLASEISSLEPKLMSNYTIRNKIVAIPYGAQVGLLEYRKDLLQEYGYDHPPRTWDELESMAVRIQAGERAKGKKDFWGYVWQGAAAEALTCNALEWQASEGGGRIIETDRTISVNNSSAIRAWQRAKRWIGKISPPSVLEYRELDSMSVFDSGNAAFDRVWGGMPITPGTASRLLHLRASAMSGSTGYTSIPGGAGGWAGTLGGAGLAISRNSTHSQEAIELVRFLIRAEIRSNHELTASTAVSAAPTFSDLPSISIPDSKENKLARHRSDVVWRPSAQVGAKYEMVTRAYIDAVHSVLAGQSSAPEAAAALEKELIRITGFSAGPPKPVD